MQSTALQRIQSLITSRGRGWRWRVSRFVLFVITLAAYRKVIEKLAENFEKWISYLPAPLVCVIGVELIILNLLTFWETYRRKFSIRARSGAHFSPIRPYSDSKVCNPQLMKQPTLIPPPVENRNVMKKFSVPGWERGWNSSTYENSWLFCRFPDRVGILPQCGLRYGYREAKKQPYILCSASSFCFNPPARQGNKVRPVSIWEIPTTTTGIHGLRTQYFLWYYYY